MIYSFRDRYSVQNMTFDTIAQIIEDIRTNKTLSDLLLTMMHGEGRMTEQRLSEQEWAYCRFRSSVFDDQWACNGHTGNMLDYVFQSIEAVHGGGGRWYYKRFKD